MTEQPKKGNGETEGRVVFHYIKSNLFRVIHLDGVIGSITPTQFIHMALYSERPAIPQRMTHPVSMKAGLGEPIASETVSREGYVREIDMDVMMNLASAQALHGWLGLRIQELLNIQRQRGTKQLSRYGGDAASVAYADDWRDVEVVTTATTTPPPSLIAGLAPVYKAQQKSAAQKFQRLATQWREETLDVSSMTDMISHPAYLAIIAMREQALPFLFDELRRAPAHWFAALYAITEENPIPPPMAGNLDDMTSVWLRWAEQHGY